jgi:ankyrin repeat protein
MNRQRVEELVGNFLFLASKGDVAAIQNLLDQGMLVDEADYDGRTALHLAASEGHASVVKLLLENKADVNPIDRRGDTVGPLPLLCFDTLDPCFISKLTEI